MANLIPITDPADARLDDYVRLRETSLRRKLETEGGLFIAEGAKIIRRAIEAGFKPRSFLLAERWLPGLADLLDDCEAPVYVVSEELAEHVTGFHVHRGALASMHRRAGAQLSELLTADRLVVCEDIVDHTNVGAIIRSAAGLGWDGVVLAPRAADPLYRRAIKTSMGTVFEIPWARMTNWASGLLELRRTGFELVAMALRDDAVSLGDYAAELAARPRKVALLLGTEGDGLSSHWLAQTDIVVRIEMHHGVDSLNVAAAAAVACYALGGSRPAARQSFR
ncbi:RNA methyltransferase [Brooklawnia sp.]|uniref:TrmH family RNA methyltransferase n=1 Tax=Brooklawnia sp. TaxID=2699740 RepID=UPI00311DEA30